MNGVADRGWLEIDAAEVDLEGFGRAEVAPFRVGRWPVTEEEFDTFLTADDGYAKAKWWKGLPDRRLPPPELSLARKDFPRVSVTWYDCIAYARWTSERAGTLTRLPTEWEWTHAVRVNSAGRYPWGDGFDPARYNTKESGVGGTISLARVSARGLAMVDTCGNVWERCLGEFGNPTLVSPDSTANRAIRGGSWMFSRREAHPDHRQVCVSARRFEDGGFRLVQTDEASEPTKVDVMGEGPAWA